MPYHTPEQARALTDSLTVSQIQATGTTVEQAQSWVVRYQWVLERDAAAGKNVNIAALYRLPFMQRVVELLSGEP
jgi:hypothetical protein